MSQSKEEIKYTPLGGRIVKGMKSHANDPQVVEHVRRGEEMLKKTNFPELPQVKKSK
jgi:hypothetical protein